MGSALAVVRVLRGGLGGPLFIFLFFSTGGNRTFFFDDCKVGPHAVFSESEKKLLGVPCNHQGLWGEVGREKNGRIDSEKNKKESWRRARIPYGREDGGIYLNIN